MIKKCLTRKSVINSLCRKKDEGPRQKSIATVYASHDGYIIMWLKISRAEVTDWERPGGGEMLALQQQRETGIDTIVVARSSRSSIFVRVRRCDVIAVF